MRELPPVEDLGGGLWSIPVPIPANPLGYTLVYALHTSRGPVLVDTGWNHDESWRALCAGLEAAGSRIEDVHGAVITHFHFDHTGLVDRLREASNAWIAMHREDAETIRRIRRMSAHDHRERELTHLRRAGAGADDLRSHAESDLPTNSFPLPDIELAHDELIDLPEHKLRVVWTPGHSPGHICLYLEDSRRLFTGDHVLPGITPHIGLHSLDTADHDPLSDFMDSLAALPSLGAVQALPAHEQRFTGIAERTAAIIEHHEDRFKELTALLGPAPTTLWTLARRLSWHRSWDQMRVMARLMATAETAAHLRVLQRRGLAHQVADSGDTIQWTAATSQSPHREL